MIRLAWTAAVSFSALPLRISFFGAGVMTLIAFEEAIRALIEHLSGNTVPGWTSLMVVICLSNAALMIAVGILGEYVGRIYEEGKGRPLYVIADTLGAARIGAHEQALGEENTAVDRHQSDLASTERS